jgi:hypothetical protein
VVLTLVAWSCNGKQTGEQEEEEEEGEGSPFLEMLKLIPDTPI